MFGKLSALHAISRKPLVAVAALAAVTWGLTKLQELASEASEALDQAQAQADQLEAAVKVRLEQLAELDRLVAARREADAPDAPDVYYPLTDAPIAASQDPYPTPADLDPLGAGEVA